MDLFGKQARAEAAQQEQRAERAEARAERAEAKAADLQHKYEQPVTVSRVVPGSVESNRRRH